MKVKQMLWIPLIITLILSTLMVGTSTGGGDPQGTLALSPETIYVEEGNETDVLPDWPYFDVNITITNVTDIVGAVFSVHWEPSKLNLTSYEGVIYIPGILPLDPIPGYPDYLLPSGTGGMSTLMVFAVDYTGGNLKEAAQIQLSPFSPKTYTDPNWGWVAKLTFEVIGTPPFQTDITIVDNPDVKMATKWTPDGTTWNKFEALGTCRFKYVPTGVMPPVALFTATPTEVTAGETVYFDATASYDPDGGTIVSYEWDFGDDTTGTGNITTHAYTQDGVYIVTLTVTGDYGLTDVDTATITVTPLPPGLYRVELKRWKARPEHRHFDISKDEDEYNNLNALVKNKGNANMTGFKIWFSVYDLELPGVPVFSDSVTETDVLESGVEKEYTCGTWAPTPGTYMVEVWVEYFNGENFVEGSAKIIHHIGVVD